MSGYHVLVKKKVIRQLDRIPTKIKNKFFQLIRDLEFFGPKQMKWKNYSKLRNNTYHCHLDYSWVACWKSEKNKIIIEVYYVGSRENAPY